MREFCKFSPEFWSGSLVEQLKMIGCNALLLAVYLQTNRHTNMLGVYYLPLAYASHDTGISLEEIKSLIERLSDLNFCHYDPSHGYIWVVELGCIQTGGPLKGHDKRVIQLQKLYEALPMVSFLPKLHEKYKEAYHLMVTPYQLHPSVYPMEGPSMPLRSKKKNKKKEIEKDKNKEKDNESDLCVSLTDPMSIIFEHWKKIMNHPDAKLDDKRKKIIQQALKVGYTLEQLCDAITGCSYTPYNMGENEQGQRYDGLHVILRDGDQIDRFIRNYQSPPKKLTPQEQQMRNNYNALQSWIDGEEGSYGTSRTGDI